MRIRAVLLASAVAAGAVLVPVQAAQAATTFTVTGTITTAPSTPLASASVTWFDPITGASGSDYTASDGTYSLSIPVTEKNYYIAANLDYYSGSFYRSSGDYVGTFVGAADRRDFAYQLVAPLTGAPTTPTVDVQVVHGSTISGSNAVLKNSTVQLQTVDGTYIDQVTASSSGAFSFPRLAPGHYVVASQFAFTSSPYLDATSPVVSLGANASVTTSLNPIKASTISGVFTSKGKPVKNVQVSAYTSDGSGYASATTDAKGRYSLLRLAPGTYTVYASDYGTTSTGHLAYSHKIRLGKSVAAKLNPSLVVGAGVGGTIAAKKGQSIQVSIHAKKYTDLVTVTGSKKPVKFTFANLPKGTYTVTAVSVSGQKYGTTTVKAKAGKVAKTASIKLTKKTVTLKGKVSVNGSGAVYVQSIALLTSGQSSIKHGSFTVKGLVPGRYAVSPYVNGYAGKTTAVTLKKSVAKKFSAGTKYGALSGSFVAAGVALKSVSLVISNGLAGDYISADSKGKFSKSEAAGTYHAQVYAYDNVFQEHSSYYLVKPKFSVTVKSGATKALGTISLQTKG